MQVRVLILTMWCSVSGPIFIKYSLMIDLYKKIRIYLSILFVWFVTEPIQCDRQAESIYLASRILHYRAYAWGGPHSALGQKNHHPYTGWTTLAGQTHKNTEVTVM